MPWEKTPTAVSSGLVFCGVCGGRPCGIDSVPVLGRIWAWVPGAGRGSQMITK
jgi:hypothetical protein